MSDKQFDTIIQDKINGIDEHSFIRVESNWDAFKTYQAKATSTSIPKPTKALKPYYLASAVGTVLVVGGIYFLSQDTKTPEPPEQTPKATEEPLTEEKTEKPTEPEKEETVLAMADKKENEIVISIEKADSPAYLKNNCKASMSKPEKINCTKNALKEIIFAKIQPLLHKKREVLYEGKLVMDVTISKTGNITHSSILKPYDTHIDKKIQEVLLEIDTFSPAKNNGREIPVKMNVPIEFKF